MSDTESCPQIGISSTKPISFTIRACQNALRNHSKIAISGIGSSISKAVSVAEILRQDGFVELGPVTTSTVQVQYRRQDAPSALPSTSHKHQLLIVLNRIEVPEPPFKSTLKGAAERVLRSHWDNVLLK
ncbi:hypothetical protein GEMRC1_000267 [Eukaryota sp. GEM-RC1]